MRERDPRAVNYRCRRDKEVWVKDNRSTREERE